MTSPTRRVLEFIDPRFALPSSPTPEDYRRVRIARNLSVGLPPEASSREYRRIKMHHTFPDQCPMPTEEELLKIRAADAAEEARVAAMFRR